MNSLFPEVSDYPTGFRYAPGFITEEEEEALLRLVGTVELHGFVFQGFEAKRKVASFGHDWSFERKSLQKGKDIPHGFRHLIEKVASHIRIHPDDFAELLVTEYPVGSVINWHRDAPPFDLIAGISLLSDCRFRLRPYDKEKQKRGSILSFPVQRRSLYVMQGPARTDWQHSIAAVTALRYSITLRTLR